MEIDHNSADTKQAQDIPDLTDIAAFYRNLFSKSYYWLWFALLFGVISDLTSKYYIQQFVQPETSHTVFPGVLDFTYVVNKGGAFSIAEGYWYLFAAAAFLALFGIPILLWQINTGKWIHLVCGLTMGGIIGNLYDRILYGGVRDFINIHVWPIFNLADIYITLGLSCLFLCVLFFPRQDKNKEERRNP